MTNDFDWNKFIIYKVNDPKQYRQKNFLLEENYINEFDRFIKRLQKVTNQVKENPQKIWAFSTGSRLSAVLDFLSLQYTAGAPVQQIKELWPIIFEWLQEYANYHDQYNKSPEADGYQVWHIQLKQEEYWVIALRLICFGLLTGYASYMPKIIEIIDYDEGNPADAQEKDGLIERLVAPFVPNRGTPPDEATRHLPYRKLFKVFDAVPENRPALMLQYLEDWYEASRREPYYSQHPQTGIDEGFYFYGYWSWEAAAVTWLLNIDDSSYRDHQFYPKDLVDFARNLGQQQIEVEKFPNVKGGEPCPKSGYWFTPAKENSRQYFNEGDIFPKFDLNDWGIIHWQWDGEK